MTRRWESLTSGHLRELADPCRGCVEWQLDPVSAGRSGRTPPADRESAKALWVDDVVALHGRAGGVLRVDGAVAAHILYAPSVALPRVSALPTAPASADALVLCGLHADDPLLYKVLLQHAVRDLRQGEVPALEAFGGRPAVRGCLTRPPVDAGPCRVPSGLLERIGFRLVRAHPNAPRYRLDVGSALPLLDQLEHGAHGLARVLRRRPGTEPSLGRTSDEGAPPA